MRASAAAPAFTPECGGGGRRPINSWLQSFFLTPPFPRPTCNNRKQNKNLKTNYKNKLLYCCRIVVAVKCSTIVFTKSENQFSVRNTVHWGIQKNQISPQAKFKNSEFLHASKMQNASPPQIQCQLRSQCHLRSPNKPTSDSVPVTEPVSFTESQEAHLRFSAT